MSLLFKAPDWEIEATSVVKDAETAKATSGNMHKSRKRKRANGNKETKSVLAKKDAIKNAQATLESLVESFETADDQTSTVPVVKKKSRDEKSRDEKSRDEKSRDEKSRDEKSRDEKSRNEKSRDEKSRNEKQSKKKDTANGMAAGSVPHTDSGDYAHIATPLPKKQRINDKATSKAKPDSVILSQSEDMAHVSEPPPKRQKKMQKDQEKVTKEPASEFASKPASEPAPTPSTSLTLLQEKMQKKLTGSRFRWINEQLYTIPSNEAVDMFTEQPNIFEEYHSGFRSQASAWPSPPLQHYITLFQKTLPVDKNFIVADMGCGDANLAASLQKHRILSYDLVCPPGNKYIVPCDIAKVPLPDHFVDVVLFCLSLMGTNWVDFVSEAHRIVRSPHGVLHIAEVKSRFTDIDAFVSLVEKIGFKLESKDDSSDKMFVYFKFKRASHHAAENLAEQGKQLLKPCIYKKR